jgi:hypothetical protein
MSNNKDLSSNEIKAYIIMSSAPSSISIIGSLVVFIMAIFGSNKVSSVAITFLILLVVSCILLQIDAYLWF